MPSASTPVLETDRLHIRRFSLADAGFLVRLLNEPAFLEHIGDKGVRTREDACTYLAKGPFASYERHGFGLWRVSTKEDGVPLGMCGLIQRDFLADVDLGYAFLAEHGGKGYALEAATATLAYARESLGLRRVVAVVSPGNHRSIHLLGKLGFLDEGGLRFPGETQEVRLFARG